MATGAVLGAAVAGAAIGGTAAWVGGAAIMTGVALGWSVGMYAGQSLFGPDAPDVEGPRLDSLGVQTSSYGASIPIVYGSMRIAGNIIWSSGLKEHKHEEDVGGKGGGGRTRTTYTYTCSFAIGICEGEIAGINRIWMDGKLFQDRNQEGNLRSQIQEADKAASISIYTGTEDQEPDPVIESHEGEGNVPGYKGLAYIVFEDLELADYGNRIPNIEVEVAVGLSSQNLTLELDQETQFIHFYLEGQRLVAGVGLHGMNTYYFDDDGNPTKEMNFHSDYDNTGGVSKFDGVHPILVLVEGRGYGHVSAQTRLRNAITKEETSMSYPPFSWDEVYKMLGNPIVFDGSHMIVVTNEGEKHFDGSTIYNILYMGKVTFIMKGTSPPDAEFREDFVKSFSPYLVDSNGRYLTTAMGAEYNPDDGMILLTCYQTETVVDGSYESYESSIIYAYDPNSINIENVDGSSRSVLYPEYEVEITHCRAELVGLIPAGFKYNLVTGKQTTGSPTTLYFFDGISDTPLKTHTFETGEASQKPVDAVVSDIMSRVGLEPSEYDTSDLSDRDLIGFAVTKSMSVKAAIKPLMQTYQFDVVEAEGQIKCTTRGKEQVRSFTENELAAHEQGSDIPAAVETARSQENKLPTKVTVKYKDQNAAYQNAAQYAKRVTQDFNNHKIIELPIVLTANDALRIAEKLLATAWASRSNYSIQVLSENIDLLPGCSIEAAGYRMHIEEISTKLPSIIEIQGTSEEPSSYVSNAVAVSPEVSEQSLPGSTPTTFSIMMNLPGLERIYSNPGFFVAPYTVGNIGSWTGAVVYKTNDGGDSWTDVSTIFEQPLVAKVDNAPGTGPTTRWDNGNTITINPLNNRTDLLLSASKLSVLGGINTAVIGSKNGDWEVISYMDVTDNGDGTYTLSGLLRGRRGTENAVSAPKNLFVLLKDTAIGFVPINPSDLGNSKDYKVVSIGKSMTDKSATSHTSEGDTIKPWSPVHIEGYRNEDAGVEITWFRRSRAEDSWRKGDVPVLESEEKYEIDIFDSDDNVVRTLSTSGEDSDQTGVTYTGENQWMDFGKLKNPVKVKIYQISDIVGRGFPATATLDLPITGSGDWSSIEAEGGTKLYCIVYHSSAGAYQKDAYAVWQYGLTTAWRASSMIKEKEPSLGLTYHDASGLYFSPSGHRMYYTNREGIHEYILSNAWDTGSMSQTYDSNGGLFVKSPAQGQYTNHVWFKPDGLKMYELGYAIDPQNIHQYSLSNEWDLASEDYTKEKTSPNLIDLVPSDDTFAAQQIYIREDGLKMYAAMRGVIAEFDFGTAWEIDTISYVQHLPDAASNIYEESITADSGLFLSSDGKGLYIASSFEGYGKFTLLETPWDISTAQGWLKFKFEDIAGITSDTRKVGSTVWPITYGEKYESALFIGG